MSSRRKKTAGVLATTTLAVGAPALAAPAPAPAGAAARPTAKVQLMIVGRARTLLSARPAGLRAATVRVAGRHCAVASATPLAVLADARAAGGPSFALHDYGHCSRAARDGESLFVTAIGPDRNAGQNGWVYKVGGRTGSTGAASLSGPLGDGRRLRAGQQLLWFWCVMGATGCQRTLTVSAPAGPVAAGAPVSVTVTGYDDEGRGTPAAGASVTLGTARASADASGRVTVAAPAAAGTYELGAQATGLVPSFPQAVVVR